VARPEAAGDGPALRAEGVWFAYRDDSPVLRGVDFSVAAGEYTALIGQNGAGKSTLAKHFNGLLRPDRGEISVEGQAAQPRPVAQLARRVGYVFQNPDHQIFGATTREEIAFGPRNQGLEEAEVADRVEEAISRFGLLEWAEAPPAVLGFGLRRKVALASVLAMHTPILVLDEPTTGMDWRGTQELMHHLDDLHAAGRTLIIITHDMRLVADYIPRCTVLHQGKVLAAGPTDTLLKEATWLAETRLSRPPVGELAARLADSGLAPDRMTVPGFCRAFVAVKDSRP
jgi:energy-coupling factor transport system ATP-binding protein